MFLPMDATTVERQNLIEAIGTLPDENLPELANFLDYLRYKSDHSKAPVQSASSFLHAIAGLGSSGQQDISEQTEKFNALRGIATANLSTDEIMSLTREIL
jgi:hypothetical protein